MKIGELQQRLSTARRLLAGVTDRIAEPRARASVNLCRAHLDALLSDLQAVDDATGPRPHRDARAALGGQR